MHAYRNRPARRPARRPAPCAAAWLAVASILGCATLARAGDPASADVPATGTPPAEAAPHATGPSDARSSLSFTPYIWLTSYDGTFGARSVESEVDASFAEVLAEAESIIGLMGAVDLRVDRWVFQVNGAFAKAEIEETRARVRSGPAGGGVSTSLDAQVVTQNIWLEAFAGYRFLDNPFGAEPQNRFTLDAFAGLRYTDLEVDLDITSEADITLPGGEVIAAGQSRGLGGDAGWFEPFIGLRTSFNFGEHWVLSLRGDVGGFDADGSQFAWQTVGALGYQWHSGPWSYAVFAGYRALGQDFEDSGVTWDVVTHGPLIGFRATVRF